MFQLTIPSLLSILSLLGTAVLSIILYEHLLKLKKCCTTIDNVLATLEDYFMRVGRSSWALSINKAARCIGTDDDWIPQDDWRDRTVKVMIRKNRLIQLEITLLEVIDYLEERRKKRDLAPKETETLEEVKTKHAETVSAYRGADAEYEALLDIAPPGPWTRKFLYTTDGDYLQMYTLACRAKGGCCVRACRCCF